MVQNCRILSCVATGNSGPDTSGRAAGSSRAWNNGPGDLRGPRGERDFSSKVPTPYPTPDRPDRIDTCVRWDLISDWEFLQWRNCARGGPTDVLCFFLSFFLECYALHTACNFWEHRQLASCNPHPDAERKGSSVSRLSLTAGRRSALRRPNMSKHT